MCSFALKMISGNVSGEMNVKTQIKEYIASLPEAKQKDLHALHDRMQELFPGGKLWFLDGRDASGKIVSNPNIGYGISRMKYADGSEREFYRVGLSANTTGISVYIMGLSDKTVLAKKFGAALGKASVSGYCIKFKKLADIDMAVLSQAIEFGIHQPEG